MKALYDSGWHHPFAAYVGAVVLLVLLARGRRDAFLTGYLVVFGFVIAADATVTGAWSPVPSDASVFTPLSILFVILGDARFFVLLERYSRPRASLARVLAVAVATSLVVPVTSVVLRRIVPMLSQGRWLFLSYELLAFVLVSGMWLVRYRATLDGEHRLWLARVTALFATLYGLWASADIVILAGVEAGHLLRIVPNVLYYAVFLPFVCVTAPRKESP